MSESIIAIVAMIAAGIVAAISAVIWIAKKAVTSIVDQNGKLTVAIEHNTNATIQLVQMIEKDRAVDEVKEEARKEHLEEVRTGALRAFEESRKVNDKLKGRI